MASFSFGRRPSVPTQANETISNEETDNENGWLPDAKTSKDNSPETSSTQYEQNIVPRTNDINDLSIAARVLSRIASSTTIDPGPPPDGGFRAWMCVLGAHLVVLNTWGVINSFGVFQSYYVEALSRSPPDIAWIGSIEIFFLFSIGTFTGRLTDGGFFHPIAIFGAVLVVTGTLVTSACTQYWQIFLAQGVCVGLGNGCLFCPSIALVSTYFQKRRSIAIGVVACGSTTGGVIFPSIARELLPRIGFAWTIRVIGLVQAVSLVVALASLKSRIPPRRTGSLVEWAAFKEMEYSYYAIGAFLSFWGTFVAFFFVAAYARDIRGFSYTKSLDLLMIMSGIGVLGRLIPNYLADRIGALTVFVPTAGLAALMILSWIAVDSQTGLYFWACFTGIALGGVQAMFPSALASLTSDPSKQGTRLGMIFTIVSFAALTGNPIAGALLSAAQGKYIGTQAFAGTTLALGMLFLAAAWVVQRRKQGKST
ncbi:unnamed protein product [Clonostachys byssicola]|uniref:Major facilitator superfamily (MFS) profile domain-containing protein n=1 Tax=Clonostachys byssicola TaxID=160290 RepID=A0A9N9UEM3_9HYPO|nr:unnamed protein product [Clonostachys byssicola]